MLQKIYNYTKTLIVKIYSYAASVTISILVFFLLIFLIATNTSIGFTPVAQKLKIYNWKADSIRESSIKNLNNANACTKALVNQYQYFKFMKKQYLEVACNFETFYYAFILILIISTASATMLGVLIAATGWQSQSKFMKAAFVGFFFVTSIVGIILNTFNNSENANKNVIQYFYLTNLQTNIYNAVAIDSALDKRCADSTLMRVFWENNKNIKDNMNLFLDIKVDKIPTTPDFSKTIGSKMP